MLGIKGNLRREEENSQIFLFFLFLLLSFFPLFLCDCINYVALSFEFLFLIFAILSSCVAAFVLAAKSRRRWL